MVFLWKWMHWLFGYSCVEIQGAYGEKFITLCMKKEIDLWEIRRVCPGIIRVKVFLFSLKKLEPLARKSGVSLELIDSVGLPLVLKRYRFRTGLFIGIPLYFVTLIALTGFVWSVEIPNADPVQRNKIQSVLLEQGFGVGSFIPSVDYKNLRYQLMLSSEEISFVSVNMEGCRAVVEVRFSEKSPQSVDDGTPCNIVASQDGQIVSVLIQSGMRYVQKGQTVQKGDLLVGGIMDTRLGYYVVHAKAKIMARIFDTCSETVYLTQSVLRRTGKFTVKREWNFFGKTINATPWFSCPYESYETETVTKHLSFGDDHVLPVTLTETYYYETVSQEIQISPAQAEGEARVKLDEADRIRLCGITVESEQESVIRTEDSITLTRTRSLIVDICEDKAFYFDDKG